MATIIDADAHIVEPRALWQEYVEPTLHGVKAVAIRPNPYNDRRLSDPVYEPFWAEAQELNCTVAVHSTVGGDLPTVEFDRYPDFFRRMVIAHPLEQQMACMDLTCGGGVGKISPLARGVPGDRRWLALLLAGSPG